MMRNVVVTGGGTGIGRAVAATFVADDDSVLILGRRAAPLADTAADLGPTVRPMVCDVSNPAEVEELRGQLPATVDVLVHCAGGNTDFDRPPAGGSGVAGGELARQPHRQPDLRGLMVAVVRDRARSEGYHGQCGVSRVHRRHRVLP